ncbi:hypothetical protein [Janthinobacterium sp. LB2P70]|uniref:hypothetical protein n=1 Tax=Janthinobacterium sp. LB2P70 TaxID=3424197 RepID=UPI003F23F51F
MAINRVLSTHAKTWGCEENETMPLLLFVQRARQLLLHTSSLLCRSDRAAPFTICREINYLVRQQKETPHSSTSANIRLLLDELRESLRGDIIATELIGDRLTYISESLISENDINNQLEAAQILKNRLAQKRYFDQSSEEIIKIIISGGREKEKLIKLTEGFIAGIRDAGYPAQTIYHLLNVSFLDKTRTPMDAKSRLDKFFSNFDLKKHSYTVYFGISGIASGVSETFASIGSAIYKRASIDAENILEKFPATTKRFFNEHDWESIVCFEKVQALDPQSARQLSERRLRLLDDLLKFSIHSQRFFIENPAVVSIEGKDGSPVHSNRPRPPVLRVPHDPTGIEKDTLLQFSSIFRMSEAGSVNRFIRALELHGTALSAPEDESQLLNIWIAFETLFVRRGDTSKIKEILNAVDPYISGRWISYEFAELWSEIVASHLAQWNETVEKFPELKTGENHYGFSAAISIKKYEIPMTDFLKKTGLQPTT